MRILLYNFVQPDDPPSKQGGGVAIYQRNLVKALTARGDEVVCMSSGDRYSPLRPRPRVVFEKGGTERAVVVDSPVFAPAHSAFHSLDAYVESPALDHIPAALKQRYGHIDAFHFQNVEGLTAGFFRALRREFADSRILVSAHNYNLVCPQVNLWFREHQVCVDYREGRACVNCLTSEDRRTTETNIRRMEGLLHRLGLGWKGRRSRLVQATARGVARLGRRAAALVHPGSPQSQQKNRRIVVTSDEKARSYRDYRLTNLELTQTVFDQVLAVSRRTRQVLIERGMAADRIAVSYIGTAHYERAATSQKRTAVSDHLHLAYLGYMRADKGFYFLLDSLFLLPDDVAARICVTIAAPLHDTGALQRLRGMAHRFRAMTVHDGYTHDTLDEVLKGVDLGVVPVLWEDNLPQVAIEMVSRGVPILTSDRGGAQEIGDVEDFVFRAGSGRDFCDKITAICTGRLPLARFWAAPPRLVSMEAHVEELMRFYAKPAATPARLSAQETASPSRAAVVGAEV